MAILKQYIPALHDIHTYNPQASFTPSIEGFQTGYNPQCHGAAVDWSGVSLRPRAFCRTMPASFRVGFTAPYEEWNINFWNTCNPCVVLVSPKHALVCQHYRGTHHRPEEYYTFLGKSGNRHTRRVVNATLNIGPDHTLLEFDHALPEKEVKIYHRIADMRYVDPNTQYWIHDCNGKAYKMNYLHSLLNSDGTISMFNYGPVLDELNIGITSSGWPGIHAGDSGSPAFLLDQYGETVLVGLMHGGMLVNETELASINAILNPQGYTVTHVKLTAKPEDINQDGVVDGSDLAAVISEWGNGNPLRDLNRDGVIDAEDMAKLLASWGSYTIRSGVYTPPPPVLPTIPEFKPRL